MLLKQYQIDHDGDGVYGSLANMGLPSYRMVSVGGSWEAMGQPYDFSRSPCGAHPSRPNFDWYAYFPADERKYWLSEIDLYKENMCLMFDMLCSPPQVMIENRYQSKLGLGVLLSGQLVSHFKPGDQYVPSWWSDPSP